MRGGLTTRERPALERLRTTDRRRSCPSNVGGGAASRCGNCNEEGHNALSCEVACTCGNDAPDAPPHVPRNCPYGRKRKREHDEDAPALGVRVCSACGKEGHKKE